MAAMRSGVGDPLDDVLDAVDGDRADGSAGSTSRSVSPVASDSPHTGDRLASVARVRSRRSVDALGVVRSWGSTPPAPSSTTSSPPDHADEVAPDARGVGEAHPVQRERR